MPWCPKCKVEYIEGYTTCTDCGSPLVNELPDQEEIDSSTILEGQEHESLNEDEEVTDPHYKPGVFMESSKKKEEYESSYQALMLVGGVTAILFVLTVLDKIPLDFSSTQRLIYSIVLGAMTTLFILIGLSSRKRAKELVIETEDELCLEEDILSHFSNTYQPPIIDEAEDDSQIYFIRNESILTELKHFYPDLDSTYIDHISEKIYEMIFEV